ncbi:MAG: diguanylate cyclase domain-containing protein, partial [bacterium]
MSPGFFSSIIVPTLFLGMLSVSSLVFLLLTIRTRTPLYHALLLTSTVALISIGAQIAGLATLGFTGDVALVAQWYRLEQVVVSIYMLSIPLLLESMVELSPRHRKLNHVLLALLLMFCSAIAVSAFAVPDLFVSLSVSGEGVASFENGLAPLMPEMRRSAAGPLRQARDLLLGGLSVYAVVSLLLYLRRENARTVLPVATGLVIAIAAGIDDLWMIYFADSFLLPGFFAVQRLPIGMTVFTLCAVGAGFSRYLSAVGEVARMRDRLSDLAYNDQLTGLRNRHSFIDRMTRVCSRPASEMTENSVAILVLDLDRFKDINDSLGHETGDQLLLEVRARLATRIRTGDELYRIGGDEFAVVLSEV